MDRCTPESSLSEAFVELAARLRADGLMRCRYGPFVAKCVATGVALVACWVGLFLVGDRWVALAIAAALGLVSTQVVFFGHDAGHHQIFGGAKHNRLVGLIAGNLITGLSFGWWEPKHGAHHAHPNQVDRDPDIARGAVAFTASVAADRGPVGRLAARHQAWTFFPLLCLEGVSLRVSSVRSVLQRRSEQGARMEAVLMAVHLVAYFAMVALVLSPLKAALFVIVQQATFGLYLGSCFAPNHKGMPTLEPGQRAHFAERQIVTARNVTGGRLVTYLLGGLNYQIEHHLFPKMPMGNLRRSQPFVRAFCKTHGLAYAQSNLLGSYKAALGHLHRIGAGGGDPRFPVRLTAEPVGAGA